MKPTDNYVSDIIQSPVFIIGCQRSGTTWLQRLLISHPELCGGQESHFFSTFGPVIKQYQNQQKSHRNAGLPAYWSEEEFKGIILRLWHDTFEGLVKKSPDAKLLVEKTPDHVRYMEVILQILPKARFIHIIRDSRSVVGSLLAASKSEWGKWAPKTAKQASVMWYLSVKNAREFGSQLLPSQYFEIHYESLKTDTYNQLQNIFKFLNVEIDGYLIESIIEEQKFDKQSATGGSALAGSNVDRQQKEPEGFFRKGTLDSWKDDLTLYEKAVVWRFTHKLMKECGYSISPFN